MRTLDQKLRLYARYLGARYLHSLLLPALLSLFLGVGGCGSVLWPSPETDENLPEQTGEEQAEQEPASDIASQNSEAENNPVEDMANIDNQLPADKVSQPILRIVFRTPATAYQSSLFSVLEMLDEKHAAVENNLFDYDILALAIDDSTAALEQSESYAKRVRQSLLDMGVAPDHIHIFQTALDIEFPMVIVYIR